MDDEIGTKEAAKLLGVGARHVRWYWETGKLPGRIVIDRLLFRRADVEAFVKPKKTGRPKLQKARETESGRKKRGRKRKGKTNGQ
jgi:excisionase family DNA binding protein